MKSEAISQVTSSIRSVLGGMRKSLGDMTERKKKLIHEREKLVSERNAVLSEPLSKADAWNYIESLMDANASSYPALAGWDQMFHNLLHPMGPYHEPRKGDDGMPPMIRFGEARAVLEENWSALYNSDPMFFMDTKGVMRNGERGFLFFFGDIIKSKMKSHFDALYEGKEFSSRSNDERTRGLLPIDQRIAAIDAELSSIDMQVSEVRALASDAVSDTDSSMPIGGNHLLSGQLEDSRKRKPYSREEVAHMLDFTPCELGDFLDIPEIYSMVPVIAVREFQQQWPAKETDVFISAVKQSVFWAPAGSR